MKATIGLCLLAAGFWFVMFSPWTSEVANFWLMLTAATGALVAASVAARGRRMAPAFAFRPRHVAVGLVSATLLYGFFFVGNEVAGRILPFLASEVEQVYHTREQAPAIVIALLLLFWIGPAEEIFWRGAIQQGFAERFGRGKGLLVASAIYALVHIWTLNATLVFTAFLCGLFWGWMYLRYRSLWPGMISHAVWDVLIFVLLPLGSPVAPLS